MSSKRAEAFRRTTARLLAEDRQLHATRQFLLTVSPTRRAALAAWLMAQTAVELFDAPEAGKATVFAHELDAFSDELSRRAITAAAAGEQSRVTETPAAAPVPPTVPSAVRQAGGGVLPKERSSDSL